MKKIYVAEDDKNIRELIKYYLQAAAYEVADFETGDALYEEFLQNPCDLALLDIMMPGTDGFEICKQLRAISNVPIILLTAMDKDLDYVRGISAGGDDYLTKPFRPAVLTMKIKALFRRLEMESEHEKSLQDNDTLGKDSAAYYEFEDLVYSDKAKTASLCGIDLELTMTELAVLKELISKPKEAISRDNLLSAVWGFESEVETRVTDETIRRIRKKMQSAAGKSYIKTVWGYGYKLDN